MEGVKNNLILWIAAIGYIAAFQLWNFPQFSVRYGFPVNLYFLGTAITLFILCLFIFINFRQYFISFLLLGLSINNLSDELFFDPTKLQLNELFFTVCLVSFGVWKYYRQPITCFIREVAAYGSTCNSNSHNKTDSGK